MLVCVHAICVYYTHVFMKICVLIVCANILSMSDNAEISHKTVLEHVN